MTEQTPGYIGQFLRNYGAVATVAAILFYVLLEVVGVNLGNTILRGAIIGGVAGGMLVPFQNIARTHLAAFGGVISGGRAWALSGVWALLALGIHVVLVTLLFAIGWQMPGILPQEQGQLVGALLVVVLILQIPLFRLYLWAGFRGVLAQKARAGNG